MRPFTVFFDRTLEALLPRVCAACERPSGREVFCALCAETLEPPPPGAVAAAAFAYGGALADAIRQAKFHPDELRARALLPAFVEALQRGAMGLPDAPELDAVTFIPLHWRRRVARGFDLPALLAKACADTLGLPLLSALRCARLDPPLSLASDTGRRAQAVRGRYQARAGTVTGARLLLVDDVVTTGATLREASRVLCEAGALAVHPLALAATPRDGEPLPHGPRRALEHCVGAL